MEKRNNWVLFVIVVSIVALILTSGCIDVDIHQKIKWGGSSDMTITIKSENSLFLDAIKKRVIVEGAGSKFSDCVYTEDKNSFSYFCKNFVFVDQKENPKSPFKNIQLQKEFNFPYYYYTYSITWAGVSTDELINEQDTELSKSITKQIIETAEFNYYVEVFGEIVDTNGQKTGTNEVMFSSNLFLPEEKKYTILFKDFFLLSGLGWLGFEFGRTNSTTIVIIFAVIVGIFAVLVYVGGEIAYILKERAIKRGEAPKGKIYCSKCGELVTEDSAFCKFCGNRTLGK